jgi:tripartite-type tricarboxylate transporter receptor subunit TctC
MHVFRCFVFALIAVAAIWSPIEARSEVWPQRAVKIIVPLSAGSGVDLAARLFAERLSQRWRQGVVVENRPGVDGLAGVASFVSARDDHELLFSFAGPISINPLIYDKLPYDPDRDLVPIASAIENFFCIAVSSSMGVDSIGSFVEAVRKNPGKFNWAATAGLPQYIFEALQKSAGLQLVQVPYRDFAPALQDFAEGRIQVVVTGPGLLLPHVKAGRAKLLMVSNRQRSPLAPEVPTAGEAGFPELTFEGVVGFYGARDMPAPRRDQIAEDVGAAGADPAIVSRMRDIGTAVRTGTPAELSSAVAEQAKKVREIVAGMKR